MLTLSLLGVGTTRSVGFVVSFENGANGVRILGQLFEEDQDVTCTLGHGSVLGQNRSGLVAYVLPEAFQCLRTLVLFYIDIDASEF